MLKPSSKKVKGSITIHVERQPSGSVSQESVSEELAQLMRDDHINHLLFTNNHDDNPKETGRSVLVRTKPFIQAIGVASTVRILHHYFVDLN